MNDCSESTAVDAPAAAPPLPITRSRGMLRRSPVVPSLLLLGAAVLLAGCNDASVASAPPPVPPEVSVVTVKASPRAIIRELPGRIAPLRVADHPLELARLVAAPQRPRAAVVLHPHAEPVEPSHRRRQVTQRHPRQRRAERSKQVVKPACGHAATLYGRRDAGSALAAAPRPVGGGSVAIRAEGAPPTGAGS